jgi:hypothetical protein
MARRYLIRNIRVEQNHADHWYNWATDPAWMFQPCCSGIRHWKP